MANVALIGAGGSKERPEHFGCNLVKDALLKAFNPVKAIPVWDKAEPDLRGIDFVIVNAEGSTHHDRNRHLYRDYGKPAVMINAVWQHNSKTDLSHFLYVSTRESMSAEAMQGCGVDPQVVPDVMFMHNFGIEHGAGLVVSDSVNDREAGLSMKMSNLSTYLRADRMVCGRFHAACLALVTGKPFSCYPSNTWKTEGMMRDAGLKNYYRTKSKAIDNCPAEVADEQTEYLIYARQRIGAMIEHVRRLICETTGSR